MSFSVIQYEHVPGHTSLQGKTVKYRSSRAHERDLPEDDSIQEQIEAEYKNNVTVVARERGEGENRAAHVKPASEFPSPTAVPYPTTPFTAAPGLASMSLPTIPQATEQAQTLSLTPSPFGITASPMSTFLPSSASLGHFPPAFLVFFLVFACLFCLVLALAVHRMSCRRQPRVGSPLCFDNVTNLSLGCHQSPQMGMYKQALVAKDAAIMFNHSRPSHILKNTNLPEHTNHKAHAGPSLTVDRDASKIPPPIRGILLTQPSRLNPHHIPRPHHHPHAAPTSHPQRIPPFVVGEDSRSRNPDRARRKGKGKDHNKGEKGRVQPGTKYGGKNDTVLMGRSSRPFSIVDENVDFSGTEAHKPAKQAHISPPLPSTGRSHAVNYEANIDALPPTPSTAAADIGLAMLAEFSSPNVGLCLDLQSISRSATATEHTAAAASAQSVSQSNLAHVIESESSGGLAYLASNSSRGFVDRSSGEERDITDNETVACSPENTSHHELDPRAQARARLVDELGFLIGRDTDSSASSFKAPTLPTLSEMALYRTDPLYESVTNELFASYGVRMSSSSRTRTSERTSRILSWIGNAGELSNGSQVHENEVGWNSQAVNSVRPLRIAKSRKNAS